MKVVIQDDAAQVAAYCADLIVRRIVARPASVLGLATGATPLALYRELVAACRAGRVSFREVSTFNLDEYWGLPAVHPQSYRHFMDRHLFDHIDIDPANTAVPRGDAADAAQACADYEAAIARKGGIDLQLLGIGRNGHIGFNEPFSSLRSRTRIKTLSRSTIADNARFFAAGEFQPHLAITMGIGTILESRTALLVATGAAKAAAIRAMVEGPVTASCPASALQLHERAVVVIDEAAASALTDVEFFKHIERENRRLENPGPGTPPH